jgi:hypothetical protein
MVTCPGGKSCGQKTEGTIGMGLDVPLRISLDGFTEEGPMSWVWKAECDYERRGPVQRPR